MPEASPKLITVPAESLLTMRGITGWEIGVELAEEQFLKFAKSTKHHLEGGFTAISLGLMTLLTKGQGFHSGACAMIRADNPYATYALIRAFAENAAALHYMAKVPGAIERFALGADRAQNPPPRVGQLVDYAKKNGLPGFKGLYDRLSEYAHPDAGAFASGHHSAGDDGQFQWSSVPSFHSDEGKRWAVLWLMELTDIHERYWGPLYKLTKGEDARHL